MALCGAGTETLYAGPTERQFRNPTPILNIETFEVPSTAVRIREQPDVPSPTRKNPAKKRMEKRALALQYDSRGQLLGTCRNTPPGFGVLPLRRRDRTFTHHIWAHTSLFLE